MARVHKSQTNLMILNEKATYKCFVVIGKDSYLICLNQNVLLKKTNAGM